MRLCISTIGSSSLLCTIARGTLRQKYPVAYSQERVDELAQETVSILQRGNRAHKLTEANLEQLRNVGEELARRLLPQPVLTKIRRTMGALTLELDEELLVYPWELFFDGEQFLCRRFDMGRVVNTVSPLRAAVTRSEPEGKLKLLLFCSDPSDDLPQVEREGLEIVAELDGSTTMLARMVTGQGLEFVRRELKEYDIVHFAGHVDLPEDQSRSGWRLQDGVLSTPEIADMGAGRPMPLLVFSNGCRSGIFTSGQPSHKAFGLAHAFLLSGVRHYVGTQWEVVDGEGALFARHFYTDLSNGATVGTAVRNARNRVIAEAGEGELAWATYVVYGDPELKLMTASRTERAEPALAPLRLGVRATAPFKQRNRSALAKSTRLEEGPGRNRLTVLFMVVTILALMAASAMAFVLLTGRSGPKTMEVSSKNPPALPSQRSTGQLADDVPVVLLRRRVSGTDNRVSAGLAVLEACLLNHLTRQQGVLVLEERASTTEGAAPKMPRTESAPPLPIDPKGPSVKYLLTVSGHVVAETVHLTVKLMDKQNGRLLFADTLPSDRSLAGRCGKTALSVKEKLTEAGAHAPGQTTSPTPGPPSEI